MIRGFEEAVRGCRFGLVFSGVTHRTDLPVNPTPDLVADDLAGLAALLLREPSG